MAKHLPRRDAGDRGAERRPMCPADYEEIARLLSPIFFGRPKNPLCSQGELVEKG